MEKILDRLFKSGLMTTILGFVIIILSIVMIYTHKSNITEVSGWLGLGLAFLRSKDTLIGIKDKNINE
jgi:hypothetical protein